MIGISREEFINKIKKVKDYLEKEINDVNLKLEAIPNNQINMLNLENFSKNNMEKLKIIIKKEEYIINFYNQTISKKNFNFKIIKETIEHCLNNIITNYKEINNYRDKNININISEDDNKKLDSLYKKYEKIYEKSIENLMEELKNLIVLLKSAMNFIKNLNKNIIDHKTKLENLVKAKKTDEELNNTLFSYYTNFLECFEQYKGYLIEIKNIISQKNMFKKLKLIQDKINEMIDSKKLKNPKIDSKRIINEINLFEHLDQNHYIDNLFIEDQCINQMKFNILFIFDITSSMGKYLNSFRENYDKIIKEIKNKCPLAIFYFGFIGYKDIKDLEENDEYIDLDFTFLYENIYKKIKDIQAEGGDDIPEDVSGAFEMALNKSWNKGTNIIFLVTDSPCHGLKYHDLDQNVDNFKDNFPEENYKYEINKEFKRKKIEELVEEFVEKNINLICLDINDITQKMFKMFEDKYKAKNKDNLFSTSKEKLNECIIKKISEIYLREQEEILNKLSINDNK